MTIEAPTANARYAGRIGRDVVAGTLQAELPDLAAFSLAAGRPLGGRVAVKALLSGDPGRAGVTADVEASTEKLFLGTPALDRTLGREPRFAGRLTRLPDGYAVQAARLTGAAVAATVDGRATEAKADMTGRVELTDLATLDPELAGKAGLEARLTGSLERPDVALTVSAPEARAMGRPVRELTAKATVTDATGALDGTVALSGRVDGKPLSGDLHLAKDGADWVLDRLGLTSARSR